MEVACESVLDRLLEDGSLTAWTTGPGAPPLFLAPASPALRQPGALKAWIDSHRGDLDGLLIEFGGIVFRGFDLPDTAAFAGIVDEFPSFSGNYQGGAAPRNQISGKVYETTQIAPDRKIVLHQEMSYIPHPPGHVIFYCHKPAERGGETIIVDFRRITAELPASLRAKLEEHGVVYVRNFAPPPADGEEHATLHPDQRSWHFAFYTKDKAEVERACREKDMEFEWLDNGGLAVFSRLPAFFRHPVTGEEIFRSGLQYEGGRTAFTAGLEGDRLREVLDMYAAQKYPSGCLVGDGKPASPEEAKALDDLFNRTELAWDWEAGDVMLLDNLLVGHGRNPFEGSRNVQVALLD